jgi:SNF2 family DNA or RNA helicase
MPIADARQYARAEKEFISWLRENFGGRRAVKAAFAERLVQMGYLKRLAAGLKLPAVFDWLDSFLEESDEKIIVFGVHRKIIGACAERYAGRCVQVHGGVLGQHRQKAYIQFQKSARCRILFGNDAAGVGWNGSCATVTAHIELPWTPGAVNQAGDRMHRIGQTKKTTEYFLVAKDTIESRLCRVLQEKQGVLNEVLDGGPERGTVLNIYDQICGEFLRNVA